MSLVLGVLAVVMVVPRVQQSWAQGFDLKITEVNYSPVGSDSAFEYFEITNFGTVPYTGECASSGASLIADRFREGAGSHLLCLEDVPATFTIGVGESVIFARNAQEFADEFLPPPDCQVIDYGNTIAFNNGGDFIEVLDSFEGTTLARMDYDGSIANNNGNSLHLDLETDTYFEAPPSVCFDPGVFETVGECISILDRQAVLGSERTRPCNVQPRAADDVLRYLRYPVGVVSAALSAYQKPRLVRGFFLTFSRRV
jgi:hypothetical protein